MIEIRFSVWDLARRLFTIIKTEIRAWQTGRIIRLRWRTRPDWLKYADRWAKMAKKASNRYVQGITDAIDPEERAVIMLKALQKQRISFNQARR